ncbi:hypothetical protein C8R45DRAFT_946262 [Mycena sanguinolenta]|nr:hypothetical protein C8R45DRAFT_946262 [Mycena sanguinolenta]
MQDNALVNHSGLIFTHVQIRCLSSPSLPLTLLEESDEPVFETSLFDLPVTALEPPATQTSSHNLVHVARKIETLAAWFRRCRRKELSVADLKHALDKLLLKTDNSGVLPASGHVTSSSDWKATSAAMMPGVKMKRKRVTDGYGAATSSRAKKVTPPSQFTVSPTMPAPPFAAPLTPTLLVPAVMHPPAIQPSQTAPVALATRSVRVKRTRAMPRRTHTASSLPGTFVFYTPPSYD